MGKLCRTLERPAEALEDPTLEWGSLLAGELSADALGEQVRGELGTHFSAARPLGPEPCVGTWGASGQCQVGPEATDGVSLHAGRTSLVSDTVVDKFEQRVRAVGLSEDVTYYFPTYGG